MKKLILMLGLVGLMACRKNESVETKVLDFDVFQLTVPQNWRAFSRQGYDSKVGGITNGRDTLGYDYGWYSYDLRQETTATHQRTTIQIDGRNALIVRPLQKGKGTMGVFVKVDNQVRFNLIGRNINDEEAALRIFKSVRFK